MEESSYHAMKQGPRKVGGKIANTQVIFKKDRL